MDTFALLVELYCGLIIKGKMELWEVPERYRESVKELISQKEKQHGY